MRFIENLKENNTSLEEFLYFLQKLLNDVEQGKSSQMLAVILILLSGCSFDAPPCDNVGPNKDGVEVCLPDDVNVGTDMANDIGNLLDGGNTVDLGNGEPDLGNGKPDLGNGEPDLGNGEPDLGNGEPDLGNGEPDLGNGEPDLGNGEPDLGNGEPDMTQQAKDCVKNPIELAPFTVNLAQDLSNFTVGVTQFNLLGGNRKNSEEADTTFNPNDNSTNILFGKNASKETTYGYDLMLASQFIAFTLSEFDADVDGTSVKTKLRVITNDFGTTGANRINATKSIDVAFENNNSNLLIVGNGVDTTSFNDFKAVAFDKQTGFYYVYDRSVQSFKQVKHNDGDPKVSCSDSDALIIPSL